MGADGAAERFWGEFKELYEAAGRPTLASLVNLGKQQLPPVGISDTTLSTWLSGRGVPSRKSSRMFLVLAAVLQVRAKTLGAYEPRPEAWWQRLLTQAQDERSIAQKAGRPRRPDGPDPASARHKQGMRRPGARSAYLEQVRRIAPPSLVDRDAELAELARFCVAHDGASYVWWRAGPWAGKSALMSWFVLHPPPEVLAARVRIVSFFITARLAAQDTREAFTLVVTEQLADLLGQSLPPVLPEVTRESFLLGLLSQAATHCEEAGGRLVLVTPAERVHVGAAILPALQP
jgi:hypothetical protein